MQATSDTSTLERLRLAVLLTQVHQPRHLTLSELDLLAAESGEGNVGDLVAGLPSGKGSMMRKVEKWRGLVDSPRVYKGTASKLTMMNRYVESG